MDKDDTITLPSVAAVLRHRFGLASFRQNASLPVLDAVPQRLPLQDLAIRMALNRKATKKNLFIVAPTASGKSLCFQLPALMDAPIHGVTIVISPLRALIEDHVETLTQLGIRTIALHQHKTIAWELLAKCAIVYVTPEKIFPKSISDEESSTLRALRGLYSRGRLARIVFDEAHCIAEDHDAWRESYLDVCVLGQIFPTAPITAMTATATHKDVNRIQRLVGRDPSSWSIIEQSIHRPNHRLMVCHKKPGLQDIRLLLEYLNGQVGKRVIIYCRTMRGCERVAAEIRTNRYGQPMKAQTYYSPLVENAKTARFKHWSDPRSLLSNILVSTTALGMGIDATVDCVIHWDPPSSITEYIQQTGRAGRDGRHAECLMFACLHDKNLIDTRSYRPSRQEQSRPLLPYVLTSTCRWAFFHEHSGLLGMTEDFVECGTCDNCVRSSSRFPSPDDSFNGDLTSATDLAAHARRIVKLLKDAQVYRKEITQCVLSEWYCGSSRHDKQSPVQQLAGFNGAKQSKSHLGERQTALLIGMLIVRGVLKEHYYNVNPRNQPAVFVELGSKRIGGSFEVDLGVGEPSWRK